MSHQGLPYLAVGAPHSKHPFPPALILGGRRERAEQRPLNSALELDLDFERTMKPPPAPTLDATASLEGLIRCPPPPPPPPPTKHRDTHTHGGHP